MYLVVQDLAIFKKKEEQNMSGSEEKKNKIELLNVWIDELIFPGLSKDLIEYEEGHNSPDGEYYKKFYIYTNENKYQIVATIRPNDDGYLGCQASTRKKRPGESWHRGNDLPDGVFSKETWNNIMMGIIRYELVSLSNYTKPKRMTICDEEETC